MYQISKPDFSRHLLLFAAIAILTTVAFFLFSFSIHKEYYPVTFSIEMKSPTDNVCQFYYSTFDRYFQNHILSKAFAGGEDFTTINFVAGATNVRYLRIDPGEGSGRFEINQIVIRVGDQEKKFAGKDIPEHFELVNVSGMEYKIAGSSLLLMAHSEDVYFVFKHRLRELFQTVGNTKIRMLQIVIGIVYLLSVLTMLLKGRHVTDYFRNFTRKQLKLFWQPFVFNLTPFSIAIAALFFVKLFLVSAQQMAAYTPFMHDDALFVKLAYSLSSGKWLGYYDSLTLAKGFGYPFFVAITNIVGIPLFLAQQILYGMAAWLVIKALSPVVRNPWLRIVLFAILLFNPTSTDAFTTRILRDGFFVSLSLMAMAAFVAVYLRRKMPAGNLLKWGVFGGVVLFMQQNTREEGVTFLPFLFILSFLTLASIIKSESSGAFSGRLLGVLRKKKTFLLSLFSPWLILVLLNLSLASINFMVYGSFVRTDIKSKPFKSAYLALTKIESEQWYPEVPVTYEARQKAYHASPAFGELKEIIEHEDNGFLRFSPYPKEILGAHFVWTLKSAAQMAGYHQSLPKSQAFYQRIADEINLAFANGKLKMRKHILPFGMALDRRHLFPALNKMIESGSFVVAFSKYSPYPTPSMGKDAEIRKFQNITCQIAAPLAGKEQLYTLPAKVKLRLLEWIAKMYQYVNPLLFIFSFVAFFILSGLMLSRRYRSWIDETWVLAILFFLLALSRIVLMSLIWVSQWDGVSSQYLAVSYPFLLLFELLALISFGRMMPLCIFHH